MSTDDLAVSGPRWRIDITTERIDTTCGIPTTDPEWTCTDSHGHPHRGSELQATTVEVVDEQHWCDGTEGTFPHDPHWGIDASHLECRHCGDLVEPGILPAFAPRSVPGPRTIVMTGRRHDREFPVETWVVTPLGPDQCETVVAVARQLRNDPGALDAWCDQWMDAHPDQAIRVSASTS